MRVIISILFFFSFPLSHAQMKIQGNYDLASNTFVSVDTSFCIGAFRTDGFALISNAGSQGVIDTAGAIVFSPIYDRVSVFNSKSAIVTKDGMFGLVSRDGEVLIEPSMFYISPITNSFVWFQRVKNGSWGLASESGEVLIEESFSLVSEFQNGFATVIDENDELHVINSENKRIYSTSTAKFDHYWSDLFPDNYWVSSKQLSHLENKKFIKKNILDLQLSSAFKCSEGKLLIAEKSKENIVFRYVNVRSKQKSKKSFDRAGLYENELAMIKKDGFWGVLNLDEKLVLPCEFDDLDIIDANHFLVSKNGRYGVVNRDLETILPFNYMDGKLLSEHRLALRMYSDSVVEILTDHSRLTGYIYYDNLNNWGVYDLEAEEVVVPFEFNEIVELDKNFVIGVNYIKVESKSGLNLFEEGTPKNLVNDNNVGTKFYLDKEITFFFGDNLSIVYSSKAKSSSQQMLFRAIQYTDALSMVHFYEFDRFIKFIDEGNNNIIYSKSDRSVQRELDYSPIPGSRYFPVEIFRKKNKWGVTHGDHVIIEAFYDGIKITENGFIVRTERDYGYYDLVGNQLIPVTYDRVNENGLGLLIVQINGEIIELNKKGKKIAK